MSPTRPKDPLGIDEISRSRATEATQAPDEASAVGGATAPEAAQEAAGAGTVEAITEGLASGDLDPVQARELLVDAAVREQLGEDASPELVEAIRAEVEGLLDGDPTLAALLQPR